MKFSMKKFVVLLVVMAMMAMIVACAGGNNNGGENNQADIAADVVDEGDDAGDEEPTEEVVETPSGDQVVIRFSMWDTVDETVNFIQAFHDANPDIRIELVNIPEDYSTVINTMVAGGTAPDVILAWEVDMPRFAANGAIIPLDDKVAASDLVDVHDFMPAVSELAEITDGIFGIPWVYAGHFLYFNIDMFEEAGVALPTDDWTWEDMEAAAEALTIRDGDNVTQWGLTAIDFGGIWYSMIGQAGDSIIDNDMNLSMDAGLRRTLEFQYRMTNELQVQPQPGAGAVGDMFAAEMAAMTRQGNWFIPAYTDASFRWDIVPLPQDARQFTNLHTGFFTISADSPHQEEAWRFVEFMMSHEGQTLLSEFSANPSAMMSVAAEGAFQVPGEHGPSNWGAFDYFNTSGEFTFVLLNSTVTGNLVDQFNAVLLGMNTIDEVIDTIVPNAQRELDALQ
ncbi:MAG: sugar ABC transporter substrate-binding protein [Lachnospiraceae bacterium]|nr:sugar ABC transporter substrate-binding protein [Lachnospiraceae bacterium]